MKWTIFYRYGVDRMHYRHTADGRNAALEWIRGQPPFVTVLSCISERGEKIDVPKQTPTIWPGPESVAPAGTGPHPEHLRGGHDTGGVTGAQKPRVWNKFRAAGLKGYDIPKGAVYIGRPSKWGNPFPLKDFRSREDCVRAFEHWVYGAEQSSLRQDAWKELRGKDLVCFCAPLPCHGDIWLRIANE